MMMVDLSSHSLQTASTFACDARPSTQTQTQDPGALSHARPPPQTRLTVAAQMAMLFCVMSEACVALKNTLNEVVSLDASYLLPHLGVMLAHPLLRANYGCACSAVSGAASGAPLKCPRGLALHRLCHVIEYLVSASLAAEDFKSESSAESDAESSDDEDDDESDDDESDDEAPDDEDDESNDDESDDEAPNDEDESDEEFDETSDEDSDHISGHDFDAKLPSGSTPNRETEPDLPEPQLPLIRQTSRKYYLDSSSRLQT